MSAAYECTVSCTDDETFLLTLVLTKTDGSVFEVDDYTFDYSAKGPETMSLDETSGITKDAVTGTLTITPGVDFRLPVGLYQHGFRKKNISTGQSDQIFDGQITVSEGNF